MAKRCLRCVPDRYSGPQEATTFRRGEVFEIQESVFTPIEHIFAAMRVSGLSGNALYRSQSSLHSIRTQERATHKHRPCILMEYMIRDAKLGVSGVYICLMGTFEKTPIENLPWIFRHFCLQVYTKNAAVVEDDHVHSIPEWPLRGDMQWIIVWRFKTTRGLGARWKASKAGSGQRTGMAFGANTTENLKDICEQRYREWKALCASRPGFAAEQEDEYRRYKNTWRGSTTGSRTASRGSQESTAVSRRPGFDAQSIVSQTIYEDQVSLFDGKAQCAVYQPGVGGAESVRRKRTRRRSKGSKGTSNTSSLASVNDKASVCSMGPKHRSPTREVFTNLTKRLSVVSLWGTA